MPDWRAIVRTHVPALATDQEPEVLDELAQHLSDVYDEALREGKSPAEALAIATSTLPARTSWRPIPSSRSTAR